MILAESCSEGSAGFPPTVMVCENLMIDGKEHLRVLLLRSAGTMIVGYGGLLIKDLMWVRERGHWVNWRLIRGCRALQAGSLLASAK